MNSLTPTSTEATFELLASLLAQCPQTIEILPGDASAWVQPESPNSESSFAPFLFVENNLGVPQKVLYKLYMYAVGVFKAAPSASSLRERGPAASTAQALIASTSILILANPSHQTALNTRKQLVTLHLIDPLAELRFMASLLSSQHCAKHAELWYHRRWLLSRAWDTQFRESPAALDPSRRLLFSSEQALKEEFELVMRACELYPRNYFAWTHRAICTRSLLSEHLSGTKTLDFPVILHRELEEMKQWIARHVSDYTAIHYILTISQDVLRSGDMPLQEVVLEQALLIHSTSLVQEYPSHETLWLYVRGCLAVFDSGATQALNQKFIENFVQPLADGQKLRTYEGNDGSKDLHYARLYLDRHREFKPS